MIERDETRDIAIEQMKLQRLTPGDQKRYLHLYFGVALADTVEMIEQLSIPEIAHAPIVAERLTNANCTPEPVINDTLTWLIEPDSFA